MAPAPQPDSWHSLGPTVHYAEFSFEGDDYEVLLIALKKSVRVSTWFIGEPDSDDYHATGMFIHVRDG
jgi:hypothetical protein